MEESPLNRLPQDTLHHIFATLPLREITICKCLCKSLYTTLSSPSFTHLITTTHKPPPLTLLALRHSHHHHHHNTHRRRPGFDRPVIHSFDPSRNRWLRFDLGFLPFRSAQPVVSSNGVVYLWGDSPELGSKSLVVCNPLTRKFRVLPQLGSAWSRHGSVLVGPSERVMVVSELAALYISSAGDQWLKFSSNLPSKPRSPVLLDGAVYALCDIGSPWRSQWKMFTCRVDNGRSSFNWSRLELPRWGDIFDILKRPRLVLGTGNRILMVGGLKSSFSLNASCSTILILRLDLETLDWDEAARMPAEMFRCFADSSKFKAFGGGKMVCFSAKKVGKRLALWDCSEGNGVEWKWIEGVPGNGDGLSRGFLFEASVIAVP